MAINDERARERYEELRQMLDRSRQHIEWLLPFSNAKASQSGDVKGLQMNAREHAENIKKTLRWYDLEDADAAAELAAAPIPQAREG